jgi:hypothetical protein
MLGIVLVVAWLVGAQPQELTRVALSYLVTAEIVLALAGHPGALGSVAWATLQWQRATGINAVADVLAASSLEMGIGLLTLGTLLAYDRRHVDRDTVDERVWLRQQERRRQLLRRWHAEAQKGGTSL